MKLDILAIGVHPDDVELSCVGTLLHYIDQGKKVGLLDLTKGELGTRGNAQLRTQEAMESARLMGATVREQLDLADGFFEINKESILPIIEVIRRYRPDIVFANSNRHPDHGRSARLEDDACFYSGLRKIETIDKLTGQPQEAWRPKLVLHYIQDYHLVPDFVFDITPYFDRKIELIKTFRSQFYDPDSAEPDSPISGKDFLEFNAARSRDFGRPANMTFAEGFQVNRLFGVKDIFDLV
jgi:bacillithiol biosynthesis deacetylase BshB1